MRFAEGAAGRTEGEEETFVEGGGFVEGFFEGFVEVDVEFFGFCNVFSDTVEEDEVDESEGLCLEKRLVCQTPS